MVKVIQVVSGNGDLKKGVYTSASIKRVCTWKMGKNGSEKVCLFQENSWKILERLNTEGSTLVCLDNISEITLWN